MASNFHSVRFAVVVEILPFYSNFVSFFIRNGVDLLWVRLAPIFFCILFRVI